MISIMSSLILGTGVGHAIAKQGQDRLRWVQMRVTVEHPYRNSCLMDLIDVIFQGDFLLVVNLLIWKSV